MVINLVSQLIAPGDFHCQIFLQARYPFRSINEYFQLSLLQIISDLLHFKGSHKHEFDSRWKSFNLVKKSMENRVRKKSVWIIFSFAFTILKMQFNRLCIVLALYNAR